MKYLLSYLNTVKNFIFCFGTIFLFGSIMQDNKLAEFFACWAILCGFYGPIREFIGDYHEKT